MQRRIPDRLILEADGEKFTFGVKAPGIKDLGDYHEAQWNQEAQDSAMARAQTAALALARGCLTSLEGDLQVWLDGAYVGLAGRADWLDLLIQHYPDLALRAGLWLSNNLTKIWAWKKRPKRRLRR